LLGNLEVTGLNAVLAQGKSFALLRPKNPLFTVEPKSFNELTQKKRQYESICKQHDMFYQKELLPLEPCPFKFKYWYETDDGERVGTCQDWETDATFFHWRNLYGEARAIEQVHHVFGVEYPKKGLVFAMGTHSRYPHTWLINGILRVDECKQESLF
jgi:hypothetical protein